MTIELHVKCDECADPMPADKSSAICPTCWGEKYSARSAVLDALEDSVAVMLADCQDAHAKAEAIASAQAALKVAGR
jgi:hypothetical protein